MWDVSIIIVYKFQTIWNITEVTKIPILVRVFYYSIYIKFLYHIRNTDNGNGLITSSQITKTNRNVYCSDGETSIF